MNLLSLFELKKSSCSSFSEHRVFTILYISDTLYYFILLLWEGGHLGMNNQGKSKEVEVPGNWSHRAYTCLLYSECIKQLYSTCEHSVVY